MHVLQVSCRVPQGEKVLCWLCFEVLQHRLEKATFGGWSAENLHYLSLSWIGKDNYSFGQSRMVREVVTAWMKGSLELGSGQKFLITPPPLSNQDVESIPGALAAVGSLDVLKFEVLERRGEQMGIKEDEDRFWSLQGGEFSQTFQALKQQHGQLLSKLGAKQQAGEPQVDVPGPDEDRSRVGFLGHVVSLGCRKTRPAWRSWIPLML